MSDQKPYAKCADCGVDLADREAVTAHGSETMAPTGEQGVVARGHRVQIVNPTDDERRASRVRMTVSDALSEAVESIYERVERGDFAVEDVTKNLWMFDLRETWDEYVAEVES